MRPLTLSLLASALLLFTAGGASGFSINHTTNYDGSALDTSDTVTVHVFLDTQGAGNQPSDTSAGLAACVAAPKLNPIACGASARASSA